VRWTRQSVRDVELGLGLASDIDYHVRLSLARAIVQTTHDSDTDFMTVIDKLKADRRRSVRSVAQGFQAHEYEEQAEGGDA
jgi:hypothetical protein